MAWREVELQCLERYSETGYPGPSFASLDLKVFDCWILSIPVDKALF